MTMSHLTHVFERAMHAAVRCVVAIIHVPPDPRYHSYNPSLPFLSIVVMI